MAQRGYNAFVSAFVAREKNQLRKTENEKDEMYKNVFCFLRICKERF